jgi:septum formation protein
MERLGKTFEVFSPAIDETPMDGETAAGLVSRLAGEKARVTAQRYPGSLIIGSDQVAACGDDIAGKPGDASNAVQQLLGFSGRTVSFLTAVSIQCEEPTFCFARTVATEVCFRQLSEQEVRRYVEVENPIDCAGSFKSEALGISLLESMRSDDPTAIIGLPLIAVSEALREVGLQVP